MRSIIRVCTAVAGALTITLSMGLAGPVHGQGGASLLKGCVGPGGLQKAFVGDPITCSIEVENLEADSEAICITSLVDVMLRSGVDACAGGACTCFGGDNAGLACAAQSDCPPVSGTGRGVCMRSVTSNLLPCDGTLTCAGGGDDGDPCATSGDCDTGRCCVRLDQVVPTVTCNHGETVQAKDNDPLVDEAIASGIDLGTGLPFKLRFRAFLNVEGMDCGSGVTDPCLVSVEDEHGMFLGSFCEEEGVPNCTAGVSMLQPALQDAVDAAPEGATLTITGRCSGPIRINEKDDLTLQGVPPTRPGACEPGGEAPLRSDLRSTVGGGCDSADLSQCELIKIIRSKNVTVKYLNIVDSLNSGLEYKRSSDGVAFCNCIARNLEEGIEFDKGKGRHLALQNLVRENAKALEPDIDAGIGVHDSPKNRVERNTVVANLQGGIFVENESDETTVVHNTVKENQGNGIQVVESEESTIGANTVENNTLVGILLSSADKNSVESNTVSANGGNGIQLWKSDQNGVDGNAISGNGGGGDPEQVVCDVTSDGNSGTNAINGTPGQALPTECL